MEMNTNISDAPVSERWGKARIAQGVIDPVMAEALAATLDRKWTPLSGAALPPLWHWLYFRDACLQSEVGADGHPQRGESLPPGPLPRRMWAGGRLKFETPLPIGIAATRTSCITDVAKKSSRGGDLVFVTTKHVITHSGSTAITEEQDIVYRGYPQSQGAALAPRLAPRLTPETAKWSRTVMPDPVLLFRYSALTFNGHRIHYDRNYAIGNEGYPGLVVHGPLIATMLVDLMLQYVPEAQLSEFNFRAIAPLFDTEPFDLCVQPEADGRTVSLWAKNVRGELAMQAQAVLSAPSNN